MSKDNIKRRPGRPRKKELKEPQQKQGLLSEPTDDKNLVEFLYEKPNNFKKICGYWQGLNAENIKFVFSSTQLIMYTNNHNNTHSVSITCDGAKMNQYYCADEVIIGVSFANLKLVLDKLDNTYENISFVIQKKSQSKTLYIILQNELNIREYFEIDIIMNVENDKVIKSLFVETDPYAIEFTLRSKNFKKMISDTNNFNKQWTIEKFGQNDLQFKYCSSNGQVKATIVPKSSKDIELKSTLRDDEIFSVSVYIDSIKPISQNQLADFVNIRASKDRPLWITIEIDNKIGSETDKPKAIVANVIINIVDHRL